MRRARLTQDWSAKVNPFFVLVIHFLRVMPLILRELVQGRANPTRHTVLLEACKQSVPLLPPGLADALIAEQQVAELMATLGENDLLVDPIERRAVAEVGVRIQSIPPALLKKGFDTPHWWMPQNSWSEFLRKEHMVESLLNALALLQMHTPLRELTQRVASGDAELFGKLFRFEKKVLQEKGPSSERLLQPLSDQATKIVGRALLLKGQPLGYQIHLRMVLFFGWDFGLCDLSVPELHAFLSQMQIIPNSYDPETLRKYRGRLAKLISKVPQRLLPDVSSSTSPVS
jgi:hypothetical protein